MIILIIGVILGIGELLVKLYVDNNEYVIVCGRNIEKFVKLS